MDHINRLQAGCLRVIAERGEAFEDDIHAALADEPGFHGNAGRVQFALLQLVDEGFADRREQANGSYAYSISERGDQTLQREGLSGP